MVTEDPRFDAPVAQQVEGLLLRKSEGLRINLGQRSGEVRRAFQAILATPRGSRLITKGAGILSTRERRTRTFAPGEKVRPVIVRKVEVAPEKIVAKKPTPPPRPSLVPPPLPKRTIIKVTEVPPEKIFIKDRKKVIKVEDKDKEKEIKERKEIITAKVIEGLDFVSGGFFTKRKISKDTKQINRDVEKFNRKFEGRELSKEQFNQAKIQEKNINQKIKNLESSQKDFDSSVRKRVGEAIFGLTVIPESEEGQRRLKFSEDAITKAKSDLKKLEGKTGSIAEGKRFIFNQKIKGNEESIKRINEGRERFVTGAEVPLTPISGVTSIKFIGTQQVKGGKILTKVVFQQGGKTVGKATGVVITQKGKEIFVTFGKTVGKLKRGKIIPLSAKKQKQFLSIEKGALRKAKIKIKEVKKVKLPRRIPRPIARTLRIARERKRQLQENLANLRRRLKVFERTQRLKKGIILTKSEIRRQRNILRQGLSKISEELKQFKGIKAAKRIKKKVKEIKVLTKGEIAIRRARLNKTISNINKELKQFKGIKAAKRISKKVKQLKTLAKGDVAIRTGRLSKRLSKISEELKQFKGIKAAKRIRKAVRKRKVLFKTERVRRRNILKKELGTLETKFRSLKPVKAIRARKALLRKSERIRRRNIIKQKITNVKSELKQFKGIKLIKKIRPAVLKVTSFKKLNTLEQVTVGKLLSNKRKINNILSKANVLPKKDFDKIVGKTITDKGDLIKFKGLIKRLDETSDVAIGSTQVLKSMKKLTFKQRKQFDQALAKVISSVGSVGKAKKIKGLSTIAKSTIGVSLPVIKAKVKAIPVTKTIPPLKPLQKEIAKVPTTLSQQKFIQLVSQIERQQLRQLIRPKTTQKARQQIRQQVRLQVRLQVFQKIKTIPRLAVKQRLRSALRKLLPSIKVFPTPKIFIPLFIIPTKKRKPIKKKKKEEEEAFDVFARPIKKFKGQKRPKLVKVNKVPLSKKRAKDLRNYIADTSLGRTARIKLTKGKPQQTRLKVPLGYARKTTKKFRTFRIIKGKRKPLIKGTVIEKRTRLLDTRQEKQGIGLRRRIKQITKPFKPKVIKRKIQKTITKTKRTLSQAQLNALAKGRAIRQKQLKGGKK